MYSASTSHTRMHGPQLASLAAAYTTYGYKQLLGSRLWGAMSSRSQQSLLSMGFLRRRSGDGRSVPSTSEARSLQTSTSVTVMPAATTTTVCGVSPSTPMSQESSGQSSEIVRSISVQSSTTVVVPSAPNQPPSDFVFPKTNFGNSARSFQSEWPKQFTWLHYCKFTDSAFCCHCMKASDQLKSSKREEAFITRGYKNWKHATTAFRKHEESDCHKEALELYLLPQQCDDIAETMQQSLRKEKQLNRKMLIIIIRSIKYLARQGLALRGHLSDEGNCIQLLELQGETDAELRAWLLKKQETVYLWRYSE